MRSNPDFAAAAPAGVPTPARPPVSAPSSAPVLAPVSAPVSVFALSFAAPEATVDEVLELPFDLRERSRLRARLLSGEEIGIDLPVGTVMHHGTKLALGDGRVVAVEASDEQLLEVRAPSAADLVRIAYHIGNRHVPIQVGDGWLRILPDHVLRAMVLGLGGEVAPVTRRFEPEGGAYGHSHVHHRHDDEGHGGRIHVMDSGTAS